MILFYFCKKFHHGKHTQRQSRKRPHPQRTQQGRIPARAHGRAPAESGHDTAVRL